MFFVRHTVYIAPKLIHASKFRGTESPLPAGMSPKYVRVLCLVAVAVAAVGATDLLHFFERIHNEGTLTLYQCYRTGNTFEPPSSRKFIVQWKSVGENQDEAQADCTFVTNGTNEEQRLELHTKYHEVGDFATLSGFGEVVVFTQLKPAYQGEAYYVKEVYPSDRRSAFKIYDTDANCTNAVPFLEEICRDGCTEEAIFVQ